MKTKIKTASCGCGVVKVHARYRRQGWKCEWETQGKICESPAEVLVMLQDDPTREGQVYCHTHLMAHTILCGHPTEHMSDEMVPTVPAIQPINDAPEVLTRARAMTLDEIIELQPKLGELY